MRKLMAFCCVTWLVTMLACCGGGVQPADTAQPEQTLEKPAVDTTQPVRTDQETLPTSETAIRSEEALAEGAPDTPAEAEEPVLPPDHWLVGTSQVEDMVPAAIAPAAPRELIAEQGPAYLERVGETRVLHLEGSHYEMGVQHGTLMGEEIRQAAALINTVGKFAWKGNFAESIREAWERTSPHIPEKYKDEIRGMAEACEMSE